MPEEHIILQELREIKAAIASIYEKLNTAAIALAVGETNRVSDKKACDARHSHDGDLFRTAASEAVKLAVTVGLTIIAVRWGMRP